jgi:hypothetical protein
MAVVETDYLVVGAGAAGMAFTDSLITQSDATVVLVDRHHAPGGHWLHAYPFVRLHQPSSFYGVASRVLGADAIDEHGPNAGFYERATASEICAYFERVLDDTLLPSGQVRFLSMSDYRGDWAGDHSVVSTLTGESTTVRVRRRVVDARYLESSVPATTPPSYGVERGATVIPVNALARLDRPASGYTVIGAGKTAMDACSWLLRQGVGPERIRWIRPRDAWLLNRAYIQPLQGVPRLMEGVSLYLEAAARATDLADLFLRLEACAQLLRIDPTVEPTMYRCATISTAELDELRRIDGVVRLGRVQRVELDRVVLDHGTIPTDPDQVHVDCTSDGLRVTDPRPIFGPDRITLQQVRTCQPTFNAALIGFIESLDVDDQQRNRLCPPNPYPSRATDWLRCTAISTRAEGRWAKVPEVAAWLDDCRLNGSRRVIDHLDDPVTHEALTRFFSNVGPGVKNLEALLEGVGH